MEFTDALLQWYDRHKRTLPWRGAGDAYAVLVSEIMLQQTRAAAVIPYYSRFMAELPTVDTLAACDEERLLKLWEGLGYYSRARNVKKCAQAVVNEHGGAFPRTAAELVQLPGVGPYTAGAIASIAFGERAPAVDGNVLRVMARLLEDDGNVTDQRIRDRFAAMERPLTENNYRDYVTFPAFIRDKIDRGVITRTHMSDLLRLELLIRYGGTWLDATVFCSSPVVPDYMMDSDLFLFQDLKPGWDGHCQRISSWMITACTGNPILRLTRALLYEYWKKNTKMADYFLFHDFFELAIEAYPEEWKKVIPCSNAAPHILLLRLFEPCDARVWDAVRGMTPFHKLSYKFDDEKARIPGTYYRKLMDGQE